MATHTYRFSEFQIGLIQSGQKRCTIRKRRKSPTRPGDTLRLTGPMFAGRGKMASRRGRLLRKAVCLSVHDIVLTFDPRSYAVIAADIAGKPFGGFPTCVDELARVDGFRDARAMGLYFVKLHGPGPFRGVLIRW
jgi:hypothetical protein